MITTTLEAKRPDIYSHLQELMCITTPSSLSAIRIWNSLPKEICNLQTLQSFKPHAIDSLNLLDINYCMLSRALYSFRVVHPVILIKMYKYTFNLNNVWYTNFPLLHQLRADYASDLN